MGKLRLLTWFCSVCIAQMKARFPAGCWIVGDVTNMSQIRDGSFDLVLDKGTSGKLCFVA